MGYSIEKYTQERLPNLSFQEYEALEKAATEKRYEFFDGTVYDMAGATSDHNEIIGNAVQNLRNFYRPRGCKVYTESVKLEVLAGKCYVYPDVMVTYSNIDHANKRIKRNPLLIIEVLSESTATKDFKEKVEYYKDIPSLQAYLIVEQTECWVRVYERDMDGKWLSHWLANNLSETITLRCGWEITLTELYADIEFGNTNASA
ncbi:MAG: Uma2 family endonuclease [Bacteroidota bacterium]